MISPLLVTEAPVISMSCTIDDSVDVIFLKKKSYLDHGLLVGNAPPCFLRIIVDGYNSMEVGGIGVGFPSASIL